MSPDFEKRYAYVLAPDLEVSGKLAALHEEYSALAMSLEKWLPDGRYKGIGLRKLEEALHWHVQAILMEHGKVHCDGSCMSADHDQHL